MNLLYQFMIYSSHSTVNVPVYAIYVKKKAGLVKNTSAASRLDLVSIDFICGKSCNYILRKLYSNLKK